MLKGRLGLETARVPHADRQGLLWLSRGRLTVEDGTLRFATAGDGHLAPGDYALPFQLLTAILLGPGSTVSHDALRLLARHGTGLVIVGEGGIRMYASMPFGPGASGIARKQASAWANPVTRLEVARSMYRWRLGEEIPDSDIEVLRGIEGARVKESYKRRAAEFGITWKGRRYDRANPGAADLPNQAINHAATAVEAAAMIAVSAVGAIPQLGFIHEDPGISFVLDIADLFRDTFTLPVAFGAVREAERQRIEIERAVRMIASRAFRREKLVPSMIERIKEAVGADDSGRDP